MAYACNYVDVPVVAADGAEVVAAVEHILAYSIFAVVVDSCAFFCFRVPVMRFFFSLLANAILV